MTLPLALLQLVSPALPVGAFSYAEGLEVLVQAGELRDAATLRAWLEAELQFGLLAVEAAALGPLQQAFKTSNMEQLLDLNDWLIAQREAPEMRAQQWQMAGSLLQLLAAMGWPLTEQCQGLKLTGLKLTGLKSTGLGWTSAWAWAGHCLNLAATDLVEAYLYGWLANQISAAVRLIPLGATEGQCLQLQLAPLISSQANYLISQDPRQMFSSGVGASLAQLQHGALYSRLFRS
ncbi:MAG: urease accessory protein UreF [Synechococcaceae bacterium WB5_2B_268]|nr:urease accessory protein UreF [Synechococcaceae bacterium WB5_2A_257]NBR44671.1 urease accessory protein UreF [Synechococcaceae bacterium WB5_2B_268]NDG02704.1 urease accessory protein UreF [Synechococcaceae bacterium WBB_34_004]